MKFVLRFALGFVPLFALEKTCCLLPLQACERGSQSLATVSFASALRERLAGAAELYQALGNDEKLDNVPFSFINCYRCGRAG